MWRYSTGLVQKMAQRASIKEALHDGVIKIYSGAQPASADAAPTGTLLAIITLASGSFTEGTPSTAQVDKITVSAATQNNQTYRIDIDPGPSEYASEQHSYTSDASATIDEIGQGLADVINRDSVVCRATFEETLNIILITANFPGLVHTTTLGLNPDTDLVLAAAQTANVRINGLAWGLATGGVLVKEADNAWSGLVLADGTAGWFRVQANAVDDDSLSTTLIRADGVCGLSNSDMDFTNLNLVTDTTVTVTTFSITIPKVAT